MRNKKNLHLTIHTHTHRKEAHGIDRVIVNDFILTHERKSSDEQLHKKHKMKNYLDSTSSYCLFILLVRSTLHISLD